MQKNKSLFHRFLRYLLDLPRKALYIALGIVCVISLTTTFAILPNDKAPGSYILFVDWNNILNVVGGLLSDLNDFKDILQVSNSNVGIGTTADLNAKLKVNGDILLSGDDRKISTDSSGALTLRTDAIDRLKITSGGNVGIGTISSPAEKLDVAGNIKTSSGYLNLSDMTAPSTPTNKLYSVGGALKWGNTKIGQGSFDLIWDEGDCGTTESTKYLKYIPNSNPATRYKFSDYTFVIIAGKQKRLTAGFWDAKVVPVSFFSVNFNGFKPSIGLHSTYEAGWWKRWVQYSTDSSFKTNGSNTDYCVHRIWGVK